MTYCFCNTYCCLWGKPIGRSTRIFAFTPWNIYMSIRCDAYGTRDRSTNTYFRAYAMTYCSHYKHCCLRGKRIGRPIRIAALTPWRFVRAMHIATFEANLSVNQYALLRLRHDILFRQYLFLPMGKRFGRPICISAITPWHIVLSIHVYVYGPTYRSTNTYWCLRGKRISRSIRISALSSWHISREIQIAA